MQHLDPHQRPPDSIRRIYKKYQKMKLQELDLDDDIVDLSTEPHSPLLSKVRVVEHVEAEDLRAAFRAFAGDAIDGKPYEPDSIQTLPMYEHKDMPGR
jgi:alkylated DNA repair protein alkB family protein 1